jgi:hypothetical protein
MFIISHRGNLQGAHTAKGGENSVQAIEQAVFDHHLYVEVDVWLHDGKLWGGHDGPHHDITPVMKNMALAGKTFFHTKTAETMLYLIEQCVDPKGEYYMRYADMFGHNVDNFALTARKLIWTYPERPLTKRSIAVMPELYRTEEKDGLMAGKISHIAGVCTDYPLKIKQGFIDG